MKLSLFTSLFLATLATKAVADQAGFLIPEDLAEGVYSVSHGTEGTDQFNLLEAPTAASSPSNAPINSRISRRQTGGATSLPPGFVTICQEHITGNWLYLYQISAAMTEAQSSWSGAGKWAGNNEAVFIKSGNAVIYMCCYDSSSRCPAWYNEFMAALVEINMKPCDVYDAAYVTIGAWKKHYGRTIAGRKICAAGVQV